MQADAPCLALHRLQQNCSGNGTMLVEGALDVFGVTEANHPRLAIAALRADGTDVG
jgi:hypothetical protein